jgi:hypothetical protein
MHTSSKSYLNPTQPQSHSPLAGLAGLDGLDGLAGLDGQGGLDGWAGWAGWATVCVSVYVCASACVYVCVCGQWGFRENNRGLYHTRRSHFTRGNREEFPQFSAL